MNATLNRQGGWSRGGLTGLVILTCVGAASPLQAGSLPLGYSPSLRADNSFYLFRDRYDSMQHPSQLVGYQEGALYTQLANEGLVAGGFNLGLSLPVGKGGLGVLLGVDGSGSASSSVDVTPDADTGEPEEEVTTTQFSRDTRFSLYLGYGLPLSAMSLGAGLRVDMTRSRCSTGEELVYCGENTTTIDYEANQTSTTTGELARGAGRYALVLSADRAADSGLQLAADLEVGLSRAVASTDVEVDEPGYSMTASGAPMPDVYENLTGPYVSLEVNPEYWFGKEFGLEGVLFGSLGLGQLSSTLLSVVQKESDPDVTSTSEVTWALQKQNSVQAGAWLAGRYRVAPTLELRGGVGYRLVRQYVDYSMDAVTTYVVGSMYEDEGHVYVEANDVYREHRLFLPVAAEAQLNPRLTVRVGAQYVLSSGLTHHAEKVMSLGEDETVAASTWDDEAMDENSSTAGWVEYSLGLEARPVPRARLGLLLANTASSRTGLTGGMNLYASLAVDF